MKDAPVDRLRNVNTEVDAALRLLGAVEPRAGLEGRVKARLAAAHSPQHAWWRLGRWELGGAVLAAGAVLAVFAVHRGPAPAPLQSSAPMPTLAAAPAQPGLSTAAGRAMPVAVVPVHSAGRAHSQHHAGAGRAAIARNAHRASGVVLPGTPVPLH